MQNWTPEEICKKALEMWGVQSQQDMALEEMGELITAICQCSRGRIDHKAVVEEIVDVSLMLEQLRLIYDEDGDFDRIRQMKIERLSKILNG